MGDPEPLALLAAGDIAVLPRGSGHRIVDDITSPAPIVFDLPHSYVSSQYAILRHGGDGAPTDVICGVVHLGHPAAAMLIDALPELIRVDAQSRERDWPWLAGLLDLMATEAQDTQPGGETVITRLSDILVIQAIRHWLALEAGGDQGWIAALRHPSIGPAIAAIHREPSNDWTVAALAAEAALSRSAFSALFTDLLDVPPKQYVTRWRMRLAEDMLRSGGSTIFEVATSLGYQSEAAFSRAFKRETGVAPSHMRRQPGIAELAAERATADYSG